MNIDTSKHQRALPESEYQFLMGLVTIEKDLKLITSLLLDFMFDVEFRTKQNEKNNIVGDIIDFTLLRGYALKFGHDTNGKLCITGIELV